MKVNYKIYSGAGNDFVMINNTSGIIPADTEAAFTADICRRNFPKIDGVIFLDKPVISGSGASIRMSYYNRDGSFGAMCGNGARCTARFAIDEGYLAETNFILEAVNDLYKTEILPDENVRIAFPNVIKYDLNLGIDCSEIDEDIDMVHWVYVGSEHIVLFIEDIYEPQKSTVDEIDVQRLGNFLRYYVDFLPLGANVNFVQLMEGNKLRIRTYERGVERETLACGTGIVSSAIIAGLTRQIESPVTVLVQSGEELIVTFKKTGNRIEDVTLEGSAGKIGEGNLDL